MIPSQVVWMKLIFKNGVPKELFLKESPWKRSSKSKQISAHKKTSTTWNPELNYQFVISTYFIDFSFRLSLSLQSALSVADRISELEKQQKYSYLDPNKKHKVPDPTLKAIQKKALLSFYERHQQNGSTAKNPWRSEPQLADNQQPLTIPKTSLPKVRPSLPSRRASSASDYASANHSKRSSLASSLESRTTDHIGGYQRHFEWCLWTKTFWPACNYWNKALKKNLFAPS